MNTHNQTSRMKNHRLRAVFFHKTGHAYLAQCSILHRYVLCFDFCHTFGSPGKVAQYEQAQYSRKTWERCRLLHFG